MITLIGMGSGTPGSLTAQGLAALQGADRILGAKRLLATLPEGCTGNRQALYKPDEILACLAAHPDEEIALVYSGDTGFYSGASQLLPMLRAFGISCRVLPGLSSVQLLAAAVGRPWQDWTLVSAHGCACDPVSACMNHKTVFFLTGGAGGTGALCQRLSQAGLGHLTATVGEDLSYPGERIRSGPVYELAGQETAPLSVLLVEGYEPPANAPRSQGLDDSVFLRGDVPMTKQEVRSAVLAKLEVRDGETYWDVGAGTGSVSVELSLLAPRSRVYAVECKGEACALIRANRERFGAYNLELAEGRAPQALEELPAPDGVFIGGSDGELFPILQVAVEKNPAVRVCLTAIAVETLGAAAAALTQLGMEPRITQITVARSRPAGGLNLMLGQNPVWIITGHREALV